MSPALAPLRGAIPTASATGGLRCAPTTGYYLSAFQAELTLTSRRVSCPHSNCQNSELR